MSSTRKRKDRKERGTMSATASRDRYTKYKESLVGGQCRAFGCGEHVCVDNDWCRDVTAVHRCMCFRTGDGENPDLCECCAGDEGMVAKYAERKAARAQKKEEERGSRKAKKAKTAADSD